MKNFIKTLTIVFVFVFAVSCATVKQANTTNAIFEAYGDGFANTTRNEAIEIGYLRAMGQIIGQAGKDFIVSSQYDYAQSQNSSSIRDTGSYRQTIKMTSDGKFRDVVVTYKKLSLLEQMRHNAYYGYRVHVKIRPSNVTIYE